MNTPTPIENAASADLRGSWPALLRAAQRARQIAAHTGTAVVVVRNGVLEHIYPQPGSDAYGVNESSMPYGKTE